MCLSAIVQLMPSSPITQSDFHTAKLVTTCTVCGCSLLKKLKYSCSLAAETLNEMCCGAPMQSTALVRNVNCLDGVENKGLLFEFCW